MPDGRRKNILSVGCIVSAAIILFLLSTAVYLKQPSPDQHHDKMPITHILLVSYKPTIKPETVQRISKMIVDLKNTCLDPETKKPYIMASKGGVNNNPEGSNKKMTHGFLLEFHNEADRNYFLDRDPAHKAFVEAIDPENNDFLTLDFTEGVY